MSLFKKSLIWIEGDVAQLVERRTSNTGRMVRIPSEAILVGDSLKSIGKKSVCFHCIISSQRWFIVSRRKIYVQMNCIWAGLAIVKHALLWHYRWKYGTLQLVLTQKSHKSSLGNCWATINKDFFLTYLLCLCKNRHISIFPKQIYISIFIASLFRLEINISIFH